MMTDKIFLRSVFQKLLICVFSVTLLSACQNKEALPQLEFPLSEEAVSTSLAELEMDLTIDQVYSPSDEEITLTLLDSNRDKTYGNLVLTTGDNQDKGRYLKTTLIISKDDLCWPLEKPHSWQEWKDIFVLSARLYGGFEGVEELYEACAGTELPLDQLILFEDQFTGGHCRVSVSVPIQDWTPYNNSDRHYRLTLELCETKDGL